jgi:Ribosomal protein S2
MKLNINYSFYSEICRFQFTITKIIHTYNKIYILNKIVQIILKLNSNSKKILLLGIDKKYRGFISYIQVKTNHCFITTHHWINGLLSNMFTTQYLRIFNKLIFFINLKLKYNFSLIIVFNKFIDKNEILTSNILSITLNHQSISSNYKICNKIKTYLFIQLIYNLLIKK